jgi:hypothetical protein
MFRLVCSCSDLTQLVVYMFVSIYKILSHFSSTNREPMAHCVLLVEVCGVISFYIFVAGGFVLEVWRLFVVLSGRN